MEDIASLNVLFVTLDCCRYDSIERANMPFLKGLGTIRRAYTHGTYTLPAHMSFFMGYLPIVKEEPLEDYYTSDVKQLWRLKSGRKRDPLTIGLHLDGNTVLDGYRSMGHHTLGYGGVRWFRHQYLRDMFDEFTYYPFNDYVSVFSERGMSEFPLNHTDNIVEDTRSHSKFFVFINSPETHVPYDFGEGIYSEEIKEIIRKGKDMWGCKNVGPSDSQLTRHEFRKLHDCQVMALEALDEKLQALVVRSDVNSGHQTFHAAGSPA